MPDAVIASTALSFDMILITRNTSDFEKIYNLKLINPYKISKPNQKGSGYEDLIVNQ